MNLPRVLSRSHWIYHVKDHCWKTIKPKWKLPTGVEISLESQCDWITFCDLFVNGEYDIGIRECILNKSPGSDIQIVDLGANVGFFYLRLLHLMRENNVSSNIKYLAVEPNPYCIGRLNDCIGRNMDSRLTTRVLRGLAGAKQGSAGLIMDGFHIGGRVVNESEINNNSKSSYIDIMNEVCDGEISLLKIDIEGSEELFLKENGDVLNSAENVIIEIHEDLCNAGKCRDALHSSGFEKSFSFASTDKYSLETYKKR